MRTTLDLPDDILRWAKIAAVQRGSSLRQLVIDALQREMAGRMSRRKMTRPPVKLSADAPLRKLSPEEVKQLDSESVSKAEAARARARGTSLTRTCCYQC